MSGLGGGAVTPRETPCQVCGALVRVRIDGCLRQHTRSLPPRWRRPCEGSGRPAPEGVR